MGVVIALLLARPLNALALGEEAAQALGVSLRATRFWVAIAVVLLAGAATAAAGPIAFIGLAVPHIARMLVGPDHRVLLPTVLLISPVMMLSADVLGRVIVPPDELQTGIFTALLGAPVFIALVRSRKLASL
nr:iron chelate uptake ABC transporter family permease subunit [Renibacterium salmoninarum]